MKWKAGWFWRVARRARFRFDLFISYAHEDKPYARQLRDQLRQLDFTCFLDEEEIQPGDRLRPALIVALSRSAVLVIVGSRAAVDSDYVALEVGEFATFHRRMLPINIEGNAANAPWKALGEEEVVWIPESEVKTPSPHIAQTIDKHFEYQKRNVIARLQTLAVTALFALVTIASVLIINDRIGRQRGAESAAQRQEVVAALRGAQARKAQRSADAAQTLAKGYLHVADERALDLAQEEGRLELLRGERPRALASLAKAYIARPKDDVLRYLVASAARGLETEIEAGHLSAPRDDADISPDGARVVTFRGAPRLWDLRGRAIATLRRPGASEGQTTTVARFADKGRLLLTAGMHGLSVWRTSDGRWLRDLRGTEGLVVHDIAAPIEGTRVLVTAGKDAYLLDVDSGNATSLGPGARCQENVLPCANSYLLLAAKRRVGAVAAPDGSITLFRMTDAVPLRTFDAATLAHAFGPATPSAGAIAPVAALSPDGSRLAVASRFSEQIALFDAESGTTIAILSVTRAQANSASEVKPSFPWLRHLEFAGDGRRLAASGYGEVLVWGYLDGEERWESTPLRRIPGDQFRVSPDGLRLMVVGGLLDPATRFDHDVYIHDVDSGALIATRPLQGYFSGGHWTADGQRLLAIAQNDPVVHIWSAAPDDRITTHVRAENNANVAVAADGRSLVVAVKGSLTRLDTVTGNELGSLDLPPQQPSFRGAASADGVRGVIEIEQQTFAYDISRAQLKPEHLGTLASVSPNGKWIATTQGERNVLIRRFLGGQPHVITADGAVRRLAFSPLGNLLMIKTASSIAAYEVPSGATRHVVHVNACFYEISPDELWLAVGDCPRMPSRKGALRLVSLTGAWSPVAFSSLDYTESLNSPAHTDSSFVFSNDSRLLLIAAHGDPVTIWCVPDGKLLQTLPVRGADTAPAFDPDGARVAVIDKATVRLFDVRSGSLIGLFASSGQRFCNVAFVGNGDQLTAVTCRWNTPIQTTPLAPWWRTEVPVWNTARERRSPDEIQRLVDLTR